MLPHTLIIRNVCLVLGALMGIYLLVKNPAVLIKWQALPLWLTATLFVWISLHLAFIGSDYDSQLSEFQSIWKRASLGSLYAIGLGMAVMQDKTMRCWRVLLLGFAMPILIYGLKYLLTFYGDYFGINAPNFLRLYHTNAEFYIPKISYIFFCLPALGLALGQLLNYPHGHSCQNAGSIAIYIFLIFSVVAIFWSMHAKNGMAYAFLLATIFVLVSLRDLKWQKLILPLLVVFGICIFVWSHLQENESWIYILGDLKVAINADPSSGDGAFVLDGPYPINDLGAAVRPENYVRFAWGFKAVELIQEHPFGYGIIQDSFGRLMKEKWPLTNLGQSHSGWLDLTLGIGLPGVLIIILTAFFAIKNSCKLPSPWRAFVPWFLGSSMLLFLTTEVAQKNYLETFILMIVFSAALSLSPQLQNASDVNLS